MDLNSDMKIRVTVTYSKDPVAVGTLPGIEPFTPGNRKLYAFSYYATSYSPKGDGCICNECAARPGSLENIRARCSGRPGEIPVLLTGSEARTWACCRCGHYDQGSAYSREDR